MNHAVICSNPFEKMGHDYVPVIAGETVSEFLERTGYAQEIRKVPSVLELDGQQLLERDFSRPINDSCFVIKPLVQEPATIAIIMVAAFAGYYAYKNIEIPEVNVRGVEDSPSLSSRNNRARIGQAKPYLIGKMRVYPDLAASAYTEYNHDNTTDLFQLFEVTLGEAECDISTATYEETPFSSFSGGEIEVLPPNTASNLFPSEVYISDAISRLELDNGLTSEYVVVPSGQQANRLSFDFTMRLYRTTSEGKLRSRSCTLKIQIHEIDDAGVEIGSWQDVVFSTNQTAADHGSPTTEETLLKFVNGTTDEKRVTHWINVPAGRYKIRLDRQTPLANDTKVNDTIFLHQVKSFLQDTTLNPSSTQIAIRLRSSDSVGNRSLSKFSIVASRKVRTITNSSGLAWTAEQETSNPAFYMADIPLSDWGGQRPDETVDLQGFYDLSVKYAAAGLECNGIFDSVTDVWKALQAVGGTCFTDPVRFGGKIGAVMDEENPAPSFFFNMRNIVQNTFTIKYEGVVDETPNYVVVKYKDEDHDYRELAIECALAGSPRTRKRELFLWGVTNRDQAFKIGMWLAAKVQFRRKLVTFEAMQEGQIPFYGNTVRVSHYMIGAEGSKQISGDVISHAGQILDLSVTPEGFTSPYIIITNNLGEPLGPYPCEIVDNQAIITDVFNITGLLYDDEHERPRFSIGEGIDFAVDIKVTNIEPAGEGRLSISGFVENTAVYQAADGQTPPIVGQLPAPVNFAPQVSVNSFVGGSIDEPIIYLEFTADNADSYIVQQKINDVWQTIDRVYDSFIELPVDPAIYDLRVAGENILIGPYDEVTVDATQGPDLANTVPSDVANLTFDNNRLQWTFSDIPIDFRGFLVRSNSGNNSNWEAAIPLHEGVVTQNVFPLLETVEEETTFLVKAVDTSGYESVNAESLVITTASAYPIDNITNLALFDGGSTFSGIDAILKWDHDNGVRDWFNYYEVKVYSGATLLRTEKTVSPFFSYNYGKNFADYLQQTASEGVYYDFQIQVTPVSKYYDNTASLIRGNTAILSVSAATLISPENLRYYTPRAGLEQAIIDAGDTANWSNVIDDDGNKPENNATNGANWNTSLSNIPIRFSGTPSQGLNLTDTHMGYYDNGWKTYFDNQGQAYFSGNGDHFLSWDGVNLTAKGDMEVTNIKTAASGDRVEITSANNQISIYWDDGGINPNRRLIWMGNTTSGSDPFAMQIGDNTYEGYPLRLSCTKDFYALQTMGRVHIFSDVSDDSSAGLTVYSVTGYSLLADRGKIRADDGIESYGDVKVRSNSNPAIDLDGYQALINNFTASIPMLIPKTSVSTGTADIGRFVKGTGALPPYISSSNITSQAILGDISDYGTSSTTYNPNVGVISKVESLSYAYSDLPYALKGLSTSQYASYQSTHYLATIIFSGVARVLIRANEVVLPGHPLSPYGNGMGYKSGTEKPARLVGKFLEDRTVGASPELVLCLVNFG